MALDQEAVIKKSEETLNGPSALVGTRGPPKRSIVWKFFYQTTENELLYSLCKLCSYKSKGRNTSTLLSHLVRKHQNENLELAQHRDIVKRAVLKKQLTVKTSSKKPKSQRRTVTSCDQKTTTFKSLKNAITALAACNDVAVGMVETEEFKNFVRTLDPSAEMLLPSSNMLKSWVIDLMTVVRRKIQQDLSEAKLISICAYIWRQPPLPFSYLGVTTHYYHPSDCELKTAALACRQLWHPHSASVVHGALLSILDEWGISEDNVLRFVADQGISIADNLEPFEVIGSEEIDSDEEEAPVDDPSDIFANDEQESLSFPRRLSCFAHLLNCTINAVLGRTGGPLNTLKEEVLHFVKKFSKSERVPAGLDDLFSRKLRKQAKTHWNSFFKIINLIAESRLAVEAFCNENDWKFSFDLDDARLCRDFLKPFTEAMTTLGGSVIVSQIIPIILGLKKHVQDCIERFGRFSNTASQCNEELEQYFGHIMNHNHEHFDPTLLFACMLDPAQAAELTEELFNQGKLKLKSFASSQSVEVVCGSEMKGNSSTPCTEDIDEDSERKLASAHNSSSTEILNRQISDYLRVTELHIEGLDSLKFWQENAKIFDRLAPLALMMLSIPATSASAERLLSLAGMIAGGKHHVIGSEAVEAEALARYNKPFMSIS